MKQRALSFLLAVCLTLALTPGVWAIDEFSDVSPGAWYYDDVMTCAEAGTVNGVGDGKFDPEGSVTGVQFIVMLTRTFYNDKVEAAKATETSSWYAPNVKVANDVGMTNNLSAVNETAMTRYDMAMALRNTMVSFSKQSTVTQIKLASADIADWNIIASSFKDYTTAVADCYAAGIITGTDGGKFAGEQAMTRAQACTVIVRMMNRINGGGTTAQPETPETPQQPEQPEQPQQTSGTLANGQPATVENVQAILDEIKEQYPDGTPWATSATTGNYDSDANHSPDVTAAAKAVKCSASMFGGCGGWAAMVSDTIFGKSGAPAHEVTKVTDLRPGDILFQFDANGGIMHIALVQYVEEPDYRGYRDVITCDGNFNGGFVGWTGRYCMTQENLGADVKQGCYIFRAMSRYPE